ncbi:hypothetical protein KUM23_25430, partial [Escherichia coli]|uniref:hypothetical protein n=1 Tax=Escherichia coli TaxID=562 RepID=UPI001C3898AB
AEVVAIGTGDITVRATSSDGKKYKEIKLSGLKQATGVSVKVTPKSKKVSYQKTITLTPTVKPNQALDKTVVYTIKSGKAYFVESGTTTYTAEDSGKATVYCDGQGDIVVNVKAKDAKGKGTNVKIK